MNENIEILQRQFDAYCTKVLKYASISSYHANRRRMEHEVSFSSLLEKDLAEVSTTDRSPCMLYRFQVREWRVEVPVSYTHRDVYKRQAYGTEFVLQFLLYTSEKSHAACYAENKDKSKRKNRRHSTAYLYPEIVYVNIYDIGIGIKILVPYIFEQGNT